MKRSYMLGILPMLAVGLMFTLPASQVRADMPPPFTCHTDQLPSPCATYLSGDHLFITSWTIPAHGVIEVRTINHGTFAGMVPGSHPPDGLGEEQEENFTSDVQFEMNVFGGGWTTVELTDVAVETWIKLIAIDGATRTFDAKLVSLNIDLGGDNLMRIDPDVVSGGQTDVTDLGGGSWGISSFFDVFMELSIDGGANWYNPDDSHPLVGVPAPGAVLLGAMGLGLVGWVRRRFA